MFVMHYNVKRPWTVCQPSKPPTSSWKSEFHPSYYAECVVDNLGNNLLGDLPLSQTINATISSYTGYDPHC